MKVVTIIEMYKQVICRGCESTCAGGDSWFLFIVSHKALSLSLSLPLTQLSRSQESSPAAVYLDDFVLRSF